MWWNQYLYKLVHYRNSNTPIDFSQTPQYDDNVCVPMKWYNLLYQFSCLISLSIKNFDKIWTLIYPMQRINRKIGMNFYMYQTLTVRKLMKKFNQLPFKLVSYYSVNFSPALGPNARASCKPGSLTFFKIVLRNLKRSPLFLTC